MSGLPAGTPGPDILAVLGGVIERGEGLEAFAVAVRAGPRLVRPADRDGPAGQGVFERRAGACATVATIGLGAARLPAVLRGGEVSRFPMPRLNVLELPALGREHA